MKEFKDIDVEKIISVSEYITRPDGGGTAYISFKGSRWQKGLGAHVSLTMDEHIQIKKK